MTATDVLTHEHNAIRRAVAKVEKEVAFIDQSGRIHAKAIRAIMDFLTCFVERRHHVKEEQHLFVIVHRRGMPLETGHLAGMLHEHAQIHSYVRAVAETLAGGDDIDGAAIRKTRRNLNACARLLRSHMDKEDRRLFPMADRILDIHDQKALCDAFAKVEVEEATKASVADGRIPVSAADYPCRCSGKAPCRQPA